MVMNGVWNQSWIRTRAGQGADLLETRGWDDRASGVIEV
jgi:hypothetical protein